MLKYKANKNTAVSNFFGNTLRGMNILKVDIYLLRIR